MGGVEQLGRTRKTSQRRRNHRPHKPAISGTPALDTREDRTSEEVGVTINETSGFGVVNFGECGGGGGDKAFGERLMKGKVCGVFCGTEID